MRVSWTLALSTAPMCRLRFARGRAERTEGAVGRHRTELVNKTEREVRSCRSSCCRGCQNSLRRGVWRFAVGAAITEVSAAFVLLSRVDAEVEIPIRDHVAEIRVARSRA